LEQRRQIDRLARTHQAQRKTAAKGRVIGGRRLRGDGPTRQQSEQAKEFSDHESTVARMLGNFKGRVATERRLAAGFDWA
jgi:hypothetical protein